MTALLDSANRAANQWLPTDLSRRQKVTIAALLLIGAQLAFRAWAVFGGWFYADDLIFLADLARGDAGGRWLLEPHDSQFMPVGLSIATVVGSLGPYNWVAAAFSLVLLQGVASVTCWWMLRTLFGDRLRILMPLGFYLFTAMTVPSMMWWAAALNHLPLQIALFGAVAAHVQYIRQHHLRHLVLAVGWLVFGYLSYVKAVGIPVVLVLITVLYFAPQRRRVGSLVREHLGAWASYLTVTAAFGAYYITHVPDPLTTSRAISYGQLIEALVYRSIGTATLGGPWTWDPVNLPLSLAAPRTFATAAAWLILLTVLVTLLRTHRNAWRALVPALIYVAFTYYLLATGRAIGLGAYVGLELRYLGDVGAVFALCLALATTPLIGATRRVVPVHRLASRPRLVRIVAAGGSVAFVAGAVVSTIGYVEPWHQDYPPRAYVDRVAKAASGQTLQLVDAPAPPIVQLPTAYPYNLPSRLLSPLGARVRTPSIGTDLAVLDVLGRPQAADVPEGLTSAGGPRRGCGYLASVDQRPVEIGLSGNTAGISRWMVIGYLASTDGALEVTTGERTVTAPAVDGLHRLFIRTQGEFDSVTIRPTSPGLALCIDKVDVGDVVPEAGT